MLKVTSFKSAILFKSMPLKLSVVRPRRIKPLLLVTILAWLPLIPMANAESIELLPNVSLNIGEQDRSGNYWDGHRWQDRDWWKKNYYYREGRYWKYDKHNNKHGKKHHHRKGHGHDHHHDD